MDFQTRANEFFEEAIKRTHEGDIGDYAFGEATCHANEPFKQWYDLLAVHPHDSEVRLHAWGLDLTLSGDIIVGQNIHALDVMSWIMDHPPVYAVGTGGLTVRRKLGTCWDHYVLLYQYPENVGVTFSSRQFNAHNAPGCGIRNRMFGSKGVLETQYNGSVLIRGESFYRGGKTYGLGKTGPKSNIATFRKLVLNGDYSNTTVPKSVRSNLVSILGRMAARSGEQVYWYQLLHNEDRLEFDSEGLKK